MPQYLVKVIDENGFHLPPIIANCEDETEAENAVRLVVGDDVAVTVKGIRPDVMQEAFGTIPEGSVTYRRDWIWKGDDDEMPEPY
jgi:hypothetical protein